MTEIKLEPKNWRNNFMPETIYGERKNLSELLKKYGFGGSIMAQNINNTKDNTFSDGEIFSFSNNDKKLLVYNVEYGENISEIVKKYNENLPTGAKKLTTKELMEMNKHIDFKDKGEGLKDYHFLVFPDISFSGAQKSKTAQSVTNETAKTSATNTEKTKTTKSNTSKDNEILDFNKLYPNNTGNKSMKDFVEHFEGFVPKIYTDKGKRAIGYGHQIVSNKKSDKEAIEEDLKIAGAKGDMAKVAADGTITQEQARILLSHDLDIARKKARRIFGDKFDKLTQNQKDVLTELCFSTKSSVKVDKLKAAIEKGDMLAAQAQLCYTLATDDNTKITKREEGLIKRSLSRMLKWNNGQLAPAARDAIMKACKEHCTQKKKPHPKTIHEAIKILEWE